MVGGCTGPIGLLDSEMKQRLKQLLMVGMVASCLLLVSCAGEVIPVPIYDGPDKPKSQPVSYTVKSGDTLYSIAWRYYLDYRQLANINDLDEPYHLTKGQVLYLAGKKRVSGHSRPSQPTHRKASVQPTHRVYTKKTSQVVKPAPKVQLAQGPVRNWRRPTRGRVVQSYSAENKGIDFAGTLGQPVYASAGGVVAYSGTGLRGYGNLIIIKHNNLFLSAYGHNRVSLVKEGQVVKPGQKIAEMGSSGAKKVMLHFELRRAGKPVNPARFIPVG